jgi:ankyrin repeat protein
MGRSEVLDFYLAMPGINVNARDIYGRTPLREACEHGHWVCLHLLKAHGATISHECAGLPPGLFSGQGFYQAAGGRVVGTAS